MCKYITHKELSGRGIFNTTTNWTLCGFHATLTDVLINVWEIERSFVPQKGC